MVDSGDNADNSHSRPDTDGHARNGAGSRSPGELLSLLANDYNREILALTAAEPLPARAIADEVDASRATVYRRLNRLEAADLVDSSVRMHAEGFHRKHFVATVRSVLLRLEDGGVTVEVSP